MSAEMPSHTAHFYAKAARAAKTQASRPAASTQDATPHIRRTPPPPPPPKTGTQRNARTIHRNTISPSQPRAAAKRGSRKSKQTTHHKKAQCSLTITRARGLPHARHTFPLPHKAVSAADLHVVCNVHTRTTRAYDTLEHCMVAAAGYSFRGPGKIKVW